MAEFEIGMMVRSKGDHRDTAEVRGINRYGAELYLEDDFHAWRSAAHDWEPIPTLIPVMLPVEWVEYGKTEGWIPLDAGVSGACRDALAKQVRVCATCGGSSHRGISHVCGCGAVGMLDTSTVVTSDGTRHYHGSPCDAMRKRGMEFTDDEGRVITALTQLKEEGK